MSPVLQHLSMAEDKAGAKKTILSALVALLVDLPWVEILGEAWKVARKSWRGLADEGIYEVLSYESTLELKDAKGKQAQFSKRELVRYQQNGILAYQDQAWGDGQILLDYKCSPGVVVDKHRPSYKTFMLISLREVKRRGDVDEFHIQWRSRNGYLRGSEQWETDISHHTKYLKLRVIFPKARPPLQVKLVEQLRRRSQVLGPANRRQLADGRWLVSWETKKPRLNERYALAWEW